MLFFLILIIIVCVLLTLVVLIQNPKGGGIAANFTSPNQIMGANRSTDVVEKATWILAITLIILSLASNFARPSAADVATSGTEQESRIDPNNLNATPTNTQQIPAGPEKAPDSTK
jgi:preprotein translocase subunit SecG